MKSGEVAQVQEAFEGLRVKVALSCRILARMGLVIDGTGHTGARIPSSDQMLIRCRSVEEY